MKSATKLLLTLAIVGFGSQAFAAKVAPSAQLQSNMKKMTGGEITKVEEARHGITASYEVTVQGPQKESIEIEVARNNLALLEAEGKPVAPNSIFAPGQGLKSLSDVLSTLSANKNFAPQEWSLDKNMSGDWVYEVKGIENGTEREYKLNAKTLAVLEAD